MHKFSELAYSCSVFTISNLTELEDKLTDSLNTKAAKPLVAALQISRLQRTIHAVGLFSLFEALLQERLCCKEGFKEAKKILKKVGDLDLLNEFIKIELAINALKHGHGKSFNALIEKEKINNDINVKKSDQDFFDEGDVSEIFTLVDVDNDFIFKCVDIISGVSISISKYRPDVIL